MPVGLDRFARFGGHCGAFLGEGNEKETSVNAMKGVVVAGVVGVVGVAGAIGAFCGCGVSPRDEVDGWMG